MKKFRIAATLFMCAAAALSVLSGCGKENSPENNSEESSQTNSLEGTTLNLYTWDGMFPQEVLDEFTEKYGVEINYSNFDYDEDMLAKLEETEGGDYDLVIADDYILEMVNDEGLAKKLDKSKLTNYGNINERFQGLFYDENDEYDVPYGSGIPLIVYDPSLTDVNIEGYEDLWNPELKDNVAIIGNYRVIDGMALKIMGESFNTEDTEKISEAGSKLLELAPNIRAIQDANTQDLLVSGEVAAAFMYTSQVNAARMANPELKAVYPKEGLGFGTMAMFIPSQAPNEDAAYAFIDYILDAQVSAKCFEYMGYYCTNKAAEEYISDEMKEYIVIPEDVDEGEAIGNISEEASDKHAQIWAEFQNACN
ncbi:MAG: polyamine ABC transporter substrate-binding protein [Lachnospiraceae bacterium]|jgi:spermidine/putrescine transport system substrate-binding protein